MRGLKALEAQGYSSKQQQQLTQRIWHPWIPRKIAAMQWLYLAGGLPIGEWRAKASSASTCRLCHSEETETSEHALFNYPRVAPTWKYLKTLRSQSHLQMTTHNGTTSDLVY